MRCLLFIISFLWTHSYTICAQKHPVNTSFNQRVCGTDRIHDEKMENDPSYRLRYERSEEARKSSQKASYRLSSGVYQVPLVVHIMHKGEALGEGSNISDAVVHSGIQNLNNFWRKVSGSVGDGDGVDMKIEFALAVQDEKGRCTNGIVRKDMSAISDYVNYGVEGSGIPDYKADAVVNSLKEFSFWNPEKYYNVWLVHEIDNSDCDSETYTAGYSFYPSDHGRANDGSVLLICAITSELNNTWAHEMGHALNLPHTFDGDDDLNNGAYQCGDDGIDDTPMHIRSMFIDDLYNDCDNADVNPCDPNFDALMSPTHRGNGTHQDHIYNHMDYSGCANEFTYGQRAATNFSLINQRASFLPANGNTALIPPAISSVDFSVPSTSVCIGKSIIFKNESTCIPNTYTNEVMDGITFDWGFDNGVNPAYHSTDQNPEITFDYAGNYTVTLTVKNAYGTDSLTKSNFITVSEAALSSCNSSSRNHSSDFGLGVTNIQLHTINHTTDTYIPESSMQDFTCTESTILTSGTDYNLSATYKADSDDKQFLEVWVDWNGSGTFDQTNNQGVNELVLSDSIAIGLSKRVSTVLKLPENHLKDRLLRMRVISSSKYAPKVCGYGLAQRSDDYSFLIRDFENGCADINACNYDSSSDSYTDNSLCIYPTEDYLDCFGVCINDTDGNGVCDEEVDLQELENLGFLLYPNPAGEKVYLELNEPQEFVELEVLSVVGAVILKRKLINLQSKQPVSIDFSSVPSGLYLIKVRNDKNTIVKPLVKQ